MNFVKGVLLAFLCVTPESMKDARTVTVTLYHDRQHTSTLYVPFGTKG